MQSQKYGINWDIYTRYVHEGVAGILLYRNGKYTIGKLNSFIFIVLFKFSFDHLQFVYASQDMRKTKLYL